MFRRSSLYPKLLMCALLALPGYAYGAPVLSISSPAADGVFVLRGEGLEGISGLHLFVSYDSATLTNPRVTLGSVVGGGLNAVNPGNPVQFAVVSDTAATTSSGIIATLSFDRTGASPGSITAVTGDLMLPGGRKVAIAPALISNPTASIPQPGGSGAGGSETASGSSSSGSASGAYAGSASRRTAASTLAINGTVAVAANDPSGAAEQTPGAPGEPPAPTEPQAEPAPQEPAGGQEVPAEVPADAPADVPAEVPADVPAEVPADVPAEVPADVPADVPQEVPADPPAEVPADVPGGAPGDLPAGIPDDAPADFPAAVPAGPPAGQRTLPPGAQPPHTPAQKKAPLPASQAGQSVLERFRLFEGERTMENLAALFRNEAASFRQSPAIAIADGKSTLTLTISKLAGDSAPKFSLDSARFAALAKAGEGEWELEVQPDQGALKASVIILNNGARQELPLTVAPEADIDLDRSGVITEYDFQYFLTERGTPEQPKFDLNGDGLRDYLDDYIFTANYLVRTGQGGSRPGPGPGEGQGGAGVAVPLGRSSLESVPVYLLPQD